MIEHADIRGILPHRHPILLVDRIVEVVPGERLVAEKAISGSEPCYAGIDESAGGEAFAYPRSLLIESLGQAGALLWFASTSVQQRAAGGMPMFAALRDGRFTGEAFPGDVLRHTVWFEHRARDDATLLAGEIRVRGERIAEVQSMLAVLRPPESVET
jgi:3-hydroxyacyl-[acyl-carrier-protein] dehydratase